MEIVVGIDGPPEGVTNDTAGDNKNVCDQENKMVLTKMNN